MLNEALKTALTDTIRNVFPEQDEHEVTIEYPADLVHGDYSCNSALKLAKMVQKSPREVAGEIVEALPELDWVHAVEIAGPGFINFWIKPDYLVGELRSMLQQGERYGRNSSGKGKKVVIEYSSPNTNKPMHLGHARNNVLGMGVANLLEANGYEVIKTQIVNDRGIHICKSMLAYQKWGRETSPESMDKKGDHFVGNYYVIYAEELKKNPALEEEARVLLRKWEMNDAPTRKLWEKMNGWAWGGFTQTYDRIGSHFDTVTFESDVSEGGRALVEKALKKGEVKKVEGGAIAIDLLEEGLGDPETGLKILVRSDGTTMYITQDLQLAVNRMDETHADQSIYVVGNEQDYHFKVLFAVLKQLGYAWAEKCHHLSYGMVDLPSGKMKSREGTTVDLDTLLDELEAMVREEVQKRELDYPEEEQRALVRKVALSALKYYLLRVDSRSRMLYNPAESIDFQGDTGPYLQYAYARIQSILRKSGENIEQLPLFAVETGTLHEPEEQELLRKLQRYPEIVRAAVHEFRLHHIATYLNELAQTLNRFYTKHSVLEGTSENLRFGRLQLIAAVAEVLKNGLAILGIEAPNRM